MLYSRNEFLKVTGAASLGLLATPPLFAFPNNENMLMRKIPATGELLPAVGVGTWLTFDAKGDSAQLATLKQVLVETRKLGGSVIDSSPMYGSAEKTVGDLTAALSSQNDFFYATKVWTSGKQAGIQQMNGSFEKMKRTTMELMQIHNLLDWETHVKTLKSWKDGGKIKYWGLTHYVDASHATLETIIRQEKPDFVQFNYSIGSRHAEKSLFDTCQKNATAVIINQPFESGSLFQKVKGESVPAWAEEYDIKSWGQYFLKFIISNETVTCVIPGTAKPHHAIDNMGAGYGKLPNQKGREKMAMYLQGL